MPQNLFITDVKRKAGPFTIEGRIEVATPWQPTTAPSHPHMTVLQGSLAERIEHAVNTAISNFESDHAENLLSKKW